VGNVRANRGAADLTGRTFGKLMVLGRGETLRSRWLWRVQCFCGKEDCLKEFQVRSDSLTMGRTQSCNCKRKQGHGLSGSRDHQSWQNMMNRCYDSKRKDFKYYGGRGVRVMERWHNPKNFFADMGPRPPGTTLDRIDHTGLWYGPGLCRWANRLTQTRNRKNTVWLTHPDGRTMTLKEWADLLGIEYDTLKWRKLQGWPDERVLSY
jgi:hypothetical protein